MEDKNSVQNDGRVSSTGSESAPTIVVDAAGNPYDQKQQQQILQRFTEGVALSRSQQFQQAEQVFLQLQKDYPHFSGIYTNLAMIDYQQGRLDSAQSFVDQALALKPDNTDAWVLKGILYRSQGVFPEAEAAYRHAITISSGNSFNNADAWLNLAILKDIYLAQLSEALICYETYARINPGDGRTENWIIDLKRRISKHE